MNRLLLASLVALVGLATIASTAARADGIEVRDQRVQNRFPDGIEFSILFASDAEVDNVRLRFRVLPDGATVSVRPDCTTTGLVSCTAVYGESQAETLLPGVQIAYSWQIEDATGAQLRTDEETYFFQDHRFEWESMTSGNLTAYYYSGDLGRVEAVLNAGSQTLAEMSAFLGTTIDFPVTVWVYETAFDMQAAIIGSQSDTSITLGEVYYSDTAAASLDSSRPLDIVRHELAHIVVRAATRGQIGELPAWVNEGIAVYAQAERLPGFDEALAVAIQRDAVLPLRSLASGSLTATDTSVFYAQSWSTVSYLIDTYGEDRFREFIANFRRANVDEALEATYGIDVAELEDAWRESVGLPPVGELAPAVQAATATPAPLAAGSTGADEPDQGSAASAGNDDGGSGISLTLVIAVLTGVAAVAILGLGFLVASKQGSQR